MAQSNTGRLIDQIVATCSNSSHVDGPKSKSTIQYEYAAEQFSHFWLALKQLAYADIVIKTVIASKSGCSARRNNK